MSTPRAHYWLLVGLVSDGAKAAIEERGGIVRQVNEKPRLLIVGLAYDLAGKWVWNERERQLCTSIEFWNSWELKETSTGLHLRYGNTNALMANLDCSAEENYILLPDEDYDTTTNTVKKAEQKTMQDDGFFTIGEFPFVGDEQK
ncbi:hypothetical protein KSD_57130 [Ktedonobacter sp. SOSP1-85]|uniref:hypothetical protein n=1 Tax=Ktedonobacter sp. SOSP1-85 TaxID=2778367 RepID=UPI0019166B51|nr:hypothetical protein [Ktedonobacter sp. SOSP1-85]GHO77942.1 hypothetical protein KSD_57130 [Ktedonobacter sp. SOSP1-85]